MFGRRLELFTLFGFRVRVDVSWLVIALLVSWSLAAGVFPALHPDWSTAMYWAMGIGGALGLFVSIIVHEFAHSLVARRYGIPMEGITLFIFGGIAEMHDEPPSPKAELWMALAGPAASLAIAGVCFASALAGSALGAPEPVSTVVGYLATINVILAVFNMLPAFPLDGGRVLRSVLWGWKDDIRWATRISSQVGVGFGALLIALGLLSLLAGRLVGGLWWILIGLFVRQGAQGSYRQLLMRREFEGEPVSRFMNRRPVAVPGQTSLEELVEDFVYRHHHKLYPVVEGERLVGCVTTREIKEIDRDDWASRTVAAVASPCTDDNTVAPDDDAMKALSTMRRAKVSRLMVTDGDRLVGILSLKDLLEFFSLKMELEDDA